MFFSAFFPTHFGKLNTVAYRGSPWGGHVRLMLPIVPIDASSCSYVDTMAVKSLIGMQLWYKVCPKPSKFWIPLHKHFLWCPYHMYTWDKSKAFWNVPPGVPGYWYFAFLFKHIQHISTKSIPDKSLLHNTLTSLENEHLSSVRPSWSIFYRDSIFLKLIVAALVPGFVSCILCRGVTPVWSSQIMCQGQSTGDSNKCLKDALKGLSRLTNVEVHKADYND